MINWKLFFFIYIYLVGTMYVLKQYKTKMAIIRISLVPLIDATKEMITRAIRYETRIHT